MANVGYATLQIIPSARGFGTALQKETGAPMVAGGKTGGKAFGGAFIGSLKGFAGPLAAVFGAQAAIGFTKSAIDAASDLNESVNAVRVSYGKAAKDVLALGKNSATAFGVSRTDFNGFAVRFSGFAQTIAGKGGNVTKTFENIATRATDFASVMNLDVAEAARLFQSGLAGELEGLRKYGVDLSMARVQTFAYSKGIAKAGEKLTQQQIVQARYGLLMKETAKTQGDFANTSDQLANRTRILSARWTNAKASLANGLLPVATKFVTFLDSALAPSLKFVTGLFSGKGFGGGKGSALGKTFASIQKFAAPLIVTLKGIGRDVMAVLKPALSDIGAIFQNDLLPAFQAFLPAVQPIANFLLKIFGGAIIGTLKGIVNVVKGVLKILSGIFNVFAGLLTGDWGRLWNGLKQIFSGVILAIKGAIQVWWNAGILAIFKRGAAFLLKGIWKKLWSGIKGSAKAAFGWLKGLVGRAWTGLKNLFSRGVKRLVAVVKGWIKLQIRIIRTAFAFAKNFIAGAWSAIRSVISNAVSRIWGAVKSGFSRIVGAIRSAIGKAIEFVRGLPGKALGALKGIGTKLYDAGKQLIQGFINGIKNAAKGVLDAVGGVVSGGIDKAKGLLGIHSPSRVFMEIGGYSAEGLARGMEKGSGRVAKATAAMVAIPDASDRAGVTRGGAGSARRALIENLTLQGSGNVHDDLEEVFFQVRRLERGGAYA